MKQQLLGLTATGLMMAAIAPIAEAAPAKIWTSYRSMSLSKAQCMSKAERVIRDAGYDYQVLGSGVYGEDGDYSVTIRCMASENVAFFIATHPNTEYASSELRALIDNF